MTQEKYAIRFGLGAIKAVGLGMMEDAVEERKVQGKFKDVYDFAARIDSKNINKKSIEALAKSGSLDCIAKNRKQIFDSFDILSAFANQKKEEESSNQMSMFGELLGEAKSKPELKKTDDWKKEERLQKEFEAFGFFLNEHPLDDYLLELKKRGVIFSDKIEKNELEDNSLIKIAGVIAASKHRSSARGRFAYLTISDPFGIFEAMIFDESLITNARDILLDGTSVVLECLVRKDDGGVRILVREVQKLADFIKNVKAANEFFEDIKKQSQRQFKKEFNINEKNKKFISQENSNEKKWENKNFITIESAKDIEKQRTHNLGIKNIFSEVRIYIKERESILEAKNLLLQLVAPASFAKKTKIIFVVEVENKQINLELPEKYLLDESDVTRLRAINKIIAVDVI